MSATASGFRYPEPSDPPEIDKDIKRLAQDVESYAVKRAGSTMTGALTLPGTDPTISNHAARKGYVDSLAVGSREATKYVTDRSWTTGSTSGVKSWTNPGTASNNPCWIEHYQNPYASRKYIAQVTYTAGLAFYEDVQIYLRIQRYQSSSLGYNNVQMQFLGGPGHTMPLSLTCTASIPANSGFSVKLEVYASYRGTFVPQTPPRGNLFDQFLNVTVHPGTNLGSQWP
jgi:hypothetical protein